MSGLTIASYVFAVIGLLVVLQLVVRLVVFVYAYLPIHSADVDEYLWPEKPYALVTGASDGIGKALAQELLKKGFNLIIHGRNAEKLGNLREALLKSVSNARDVQVVVMDAAAGSWDFAPLLKQLSGLDLTVVAFVAGGSPVKMHCIDGQTDAEVLGTVSFSYLFPLLLTKALLPSLRATRKRGPVLLFSLGSLASLVMPPYLSIYASAKSGLETLLRGIAADERFAACGGPRITVRYLQVASVNTHLNQTPVSLSCPSADTFAVDILRRVHAPWRWACANFVHAVSAWFVALCGERVAEWLGCRAMVALHGDEMTRKKP